MTVQVSESTTQPTIVVVSGEWDAACEHVDAALVDAVATSDGRVVVDMSDVTFIDSSAIRALVLAHRRAAQRGGWLRIAYTHNVIGKVLGICGLTEMFAQHETVEAALRGAPPAQTQLHSDHR